jgi:hypothetical protein
MRHRLPAALAVLVTGAAVIAPLLTAGSASAAPVSLTKASCTAQGGTFTRSHGVKTCTVQDPSYDCNNYSNLPAQEPAVTAGGSGYYGTYTANLCYQTTTVQTQKGTGPVTTTITTTLKSRTVLSYDACSYFDSASNSSLSAYPYQCVDAGDVYPVTFYS